MNTPDPTMPQIVAEQVPALPQQQLDASQALAVFVQDPVGFVQGIVEQSAASHLANLKDEAELNGALRAIRREKPEFARFESFILQEVADLIRNDPDGVLDPWQDLLEKGFEQFKSKFKETLETNPDLLTARKAEKAGEAAAAYVEGSSNRTTPGEPAIFSRDQIARMSIADFLANEAAINDALKNNRIR